MRRQMRRQMPTRTAQKNRTIKQQSEHLYVSMKESSFHLSQINKWKAAHDSYLWQAQLDEINARLRSTSYTDHGDRKTLLALILSHGARLPSGNRGMLLSNLNRFFKISKRTLRTIVGQGDLLLCLDMTEHKESVSLKWDLRSNR